MLYKTLKKPFFGRYMVKWKKPLTEEEFQEWEPMDIYSKSGGVIRCLFAHSRASKAKATIVLGHPMGKAAKGYFLKYGYTDLLLDNGFNVMLFDLNGFGESTHGNFSYYYDIIAVSQIAKNLTPTLPIGYHGISLGGMWAAVSFADETHCYDFAILESVATSLEDFWVNFPMAYRVLRVLGFFMPRYQRHVRMIDRIRQVKNLNSLLFIYSQTDPWTTVAMGEQFIKYSNVKAELWTVADAKHAYIMKSPHREEYQQKILDYFNEMSRKQYH